MVAFKNKNVRGQRDGTRSRTVIDQVHKRAKAAAERYPIAHRVKLALTGSGDWEETFQVLNDGDIRGYKDADRLRVHVGRKGTLEDGQVAAVVEDVQTGDDVAEDILWGEVRGHRDGTGETCRMLSWIWTNNSQTSNPDDENDDILRAEWAKSWAQAARCCEEVMLLKEEMRHVIAFLEWKRGWWMDRQGSRNDVMNKELLEGLRAYAEGQADLQRMIEEEFCSIWKLSLTDETATSDNDADDNANDGDEDEDGKSKCDEDIGEVPSDTDMN